jgi:hypothetical protein
LSEIGTLKNRPLHWFIEAVHYVGADGYLPDEPSGDGKGRRIPGEQGDAVPMPTGNQLLQKD